jgi:histidinol-phosphate/aromatic aminotransferase/cobyric acid decarboxylase-like protein
VTDLPGAELAALAARGFTRRGILRAVALATAGAALPFASERALAQLSNLGRLPDDAVKINANEFPIGPTDAAIAALVEVAKRGNRYQYPETDDFLAAAAAQLGIDRDHLAPYPGSSLALHHAVIAFTGPGKALVTSDPGYEAAASAAEFIGAPVVRVPLAKSGGHDVHAMAERAKAVGAGRLYVCNPNNPTGTITPRPEIEWLYAQRPAGATLLLDEAYVHFCDEPPGTDLVRAGRDVVVLRTFSKIYGMAGLRAGLAIARPDLLKRVTAWQTGALPATAMVAARVMLNDPALVPDRKKWLAGRRADLMRFLDEQGFAYTPSVSNKLMVDARLPTKQVIEGLAARGVYVGRPWAIWPTHVRVSIGSDADMARFKAAFVEVAKTG